MTISLGAFELRSRLARGGMGEVWQAFHSISGESVAVKVLMGLRAADPRYVEEFRREVMATARLHHPSIVRIYEYGVVQDTPAIRHENLTPGAPYFVMQMCAHGTLLDLTPGLDWTRTQNILSTLLAALAHAHARSVIHRDIKPGNVLVSDLQHAEVLLTDFGIAHATDRHTRTGSMEITSRSIEDASGTPKYMAPEQFLGRWRDYGPWTDLYAIGVMAYEMVQGKAPYSASTFVMFAMEHMYQPFPELHPRFPVPDGFVGWLHRMVAKRPAERFQHAADAAHALKMLTRTHTGETGTAESVDDHAVTHYNVQSIQGLSATHIDAEFASRDYSQKTDLPQVPAHWQVLESNISNDLRGAGLSLFGLRSVPLIGREYERNALWESLKTCQNQTRAVILKGTSGAGKTALAEWLLRRAAECGAATVFRTGHNATPGARHGIAWMLTSFFRAAGLSEAAMETRVKDILASVPGTTDVHARALYEIMRNAPSDNVTGDDNASRIQFSSPATRHGFVLRTVLLEASLRPVVVFLDDAHYESDSLEFALMALQKPFGDAGLLVVITVDEEAPHSLEAKDALLRLLAHPHCQNLRISQPDTAIVEGLLTRMGLSPDIASNVSAHAGSDISFAIQLVKDWVERGRLHLEGNQLVLEDDGESRALPASLQEIWEDQLLILENGFSVVRLIGAANISIPIEPNEVIEALEIAAALGREFDKEEWISACERAHLPRIPEVFDTLALRGLGTHMDSSFHFASDAFRKHLQDRAMERGSWKKANTACAQMLTSRYRPEHPGLALRVARHFVESHEWLLANITLEEAYTQAFRTGHQDKLREVLALQEAALRGAAVPETDLRWADLWLRQAKGMVWREDPESRSSGEALLTLAERIARQNPPARGAKLLTKVLCARVWVCSLNHDLVQAERYAQEALNVAPNDKERAIAHRMKGQLHYEKGELDPAEFHYDQSMLVTKDPIDLLSAWKGLADIAVRRLDREKANQHLQSALECAQTHGLIFGESLVYNTLALLAEEDEDWATAVTFRRRQLELTQMLNPNSFINGEVAQRLRQNLEKVAQTAS